MLKEPELSNGSITMQVKSSVQHTPQNKGMSIFLYCNNKGIPLFQFTAESMTVK